MAMSEQYVRVQNITDSPRRVVDSRLPGGKVEIPAGETLSLDKGVYATHFRDIGRWGVNLDSAGYKAMIERMEREAAEEPEKAPAKPAKKPAKK